MQVGTKVKAKRNIPALLVKEGDFGYVYETYDIGHFGVSVIFEKGGYDGFSENEQEFFLENVGVDENYENYEFTNVGNLRRDWERGYWNFC